ncbi:phosphotransferase family protein [Glycomyces sp. NPDC048151]|uniref:phosphotransferase family protein n=1 Tax=Glycomyces sp. NPDC048151 TaxID=3364002 RepID=UPI0037201E7D
MKDPLDALDQRQRSLLAAWLPDIAIEADMSWDLVGTVVLRAKAGDRLVVVKAAGPDDPHLLREIHAHREWTGPWTRTGRAPRLLHADPGARLIVTEYLPGTLVRDTPAAADPALYAQAGELLRVFHDQAAVDDPDYEARMDAKALAWLDGTHRIEPETTEQLRAMVRSWSPEPVTCVPTHGDWQTRNWLNDNGIVRVIDFGRTDLRPAIEDFARLAVQEFRWHPGTEDAFLTGYGTDPRRPGAWFRQRVRSAISTACWAYSVRAEDFEAQGHRMIADVLAETD